MAGKKIVVVGDVMLDVTLRAKAAGVAEEGPCLLLEHEGAETRPAAAAGLALDLLKAGAEVALIGVIGEDDEGAELLKLPDEMDVNLFVGEGGRPTTRRFRVESGGRVLVRVDRGTRAPIGVELRTLLWRHVKDCGAGADAIALYHAGRGVMTECFSLKIRTWAETKGIRVVTVAEGGDVLGRIRGALQEGKP